MLTLPLPIREQMAYSSYIPMIDEQRGVSREQYREMMRNALEFQQYEIIRIRRMDAFRLYYDEQRSKTFVAEADEQARLEYLFFHRGPEDESWVSQLELKENKPFIHNNPYDHRDIFLDEYQQLIEHKKRENRVRHSEKKPIEDIPTESNQPLLLIPTKFHAPTVAPFPEGPDVMSTALNMPLIAALYLQPQALPAKVQLSKEHQINGLNNALANNYLDLDLRK